MFTQKPAHKCLYISSIHNPKLDEYLPHCLERSKHLSLIKYSKNSIMKRLTFPRVYYTKATPGLLQIRQCQVLNITFKDYNKLFLSPNKSLVKQPYGINIRVFFFLRLEKKFFCNWRGKIFFKNWSSGWQKLPFFPYLGKGN